MKIIENDPVSTDWIKKVKQRELPVKKFNPFHEPAGSPTGGQFASGDNPPYDLQRSAAELMKLKKGFGIPPMAQFSDPDAYASKMKNQVATKLSDQLRDNPDFQRLAQTLQLEWRGDPDKLAGKSDEYVAAAKLISQWAATASDTDPHSHLIQMAVAEEFGLGKQTLQALSAQVKGEDIFPIELARLKKQYKTTDEEGNSAWKGLKAFARAQYDLTQAEFKRLGITEVELSRGMGVPTAGIEFNDYATRAVGIEGRISLHSASLAFGEATFKSMPVSSYSFLDRVAVGFAHGSTLGKSSSILVAKVPVTDILSTARTGFGSAEEAEFTVLGRPRQVNYIVNNRDYSNLKKYEVRMNVLVDGRHFLGQTNDDLVTRQTLNYLHSKQASERSAKVLQEFLNLPRPKETYTADQLKSDLRGFVGGDKLDHERRQPDNAPD